MKLSPETRAKRAKLRRAIKLYTLWYEADSWKGGGDPADIPGIEAKLREADEHLQAVIAEVLP